MTKASVDAIFVEQEQYEGGPFIFDGSLDDVIASLIAIRDAIPPEFRENASCLIDASGGCYESNLAAIEVKGWRWETDDEEREREARESAYRAEEAKITAARQEAFDRAEFARLSAKFGR
jgi:hypothetical protein